MFVSWVIPYSMPGDFRSTRFTTLSQRTELTYGHTSIGTVSRYTGVSSYGETRSSIGQTFLSSATSTTRQNVTSSATALHLGETSTGSTTESGVTWHDGSIDGTTVPASGTNSFSGITTSSTTGKTFTAAEAATNGAGITTVSDAAYRVATTSSYSFETSSSSGSGTSSSSWTTSSSSAYLDYSYLQTSSNVPTSKTWAGSLSYGVDGSVQSSFSSSGTLATVYRMAPGYAAWVGNSAGSGLSKFADAGSSGTQVTVYPFVQSSRSFSLDKVTFTGSVAGSTLTATLIPSASGTKHSISYETLTKTIAVDSNYMPVVPTPTMTVTSFAAVSITTTWAQAQVTSEIAIGPLSFDYQTDWQTTCTTSATYAKSTTGKTVIAGSLLTSHSTVEETVSFTTKSSVVVAHTGGNTISTANSTFASSRDLGVTERAYTTGKMLLTPVGGWAREIWAEWLSGIRLPDELTNSTVAHSSVGGLAFSVPFSPGTAALGQIIAPYPVSVVSKTTTAIDYGTDYTSPTTSQYAWKATGNVVSVSRTIQFSTTTSTTGDPSTTTCVSQDTSSCSGTLTGEGTVGATICSQSASSAQPWIYGGSDIYPGSGRSIQMGPGVCRKGTSEVTSQTSSIESSSVPSVSALTVLPLYSAGGNTPTVFGPLTSAWTPGHWVPLSRYTYTGEE